MDIGYRMTSGSTRYGPISRYGGLRLGEMGNWQSRREFSGHDSMVRDDRQLEIVDDFGELGDEVLAEEITILLTSYVAKRLIEALGRKDDGNESNN
jgi:hypothetical protein